MKKLLAMAALCAVVITGCKKDKDNLEDLAGLKLSNPKNMIKPAETLSLNVEFFPSNARDKSLTWLTSDASVATVTDGKITAGSKEGFAVVTATSVSNPTISATFTVAVSSTDMVIMSGNVEGTWAKGTTVLINDQIKVPAGKKLFVEEGVTIIVQNGPVGASQAHIEFFVDGSLYLQGTKENPILVTVPAPMRDPAANKYVGLWGGFVGSQIFEEMLFNYVTIEYTGAVTVAASQSAAAGIIEKVGNRTSAILTDNPKGKVVVMHSTIRYAESDAIYFMGCEAIVAHNIIHTVGATDNDGINTKAGVKIDIAYNLMFGVNSNGLKLNSKGQSIDRYQSIKCVYNNTIVNSGWRRTKNLKGGSIFIQQNASAYVFNNLLLNCKLVTKTPELDNPSPDAGACHSTFVGYNFYASGSQTWTGANPPGTPNIPTAFFGYTQYTDDDIWHDWSNYPAAFPKIDQTSLFAASAGAPDPNFVNFGFNTVPLGEDMFDPTWDFRVNSASSPIIAGVGDKKPRTQFTERFAPYFAVNGLRMNGVEYKSPLPKAQYGAHGVR
ncbi:MAG: Ig-like domain-containing protein [Bacteroidales bacterium]|nr:Ig-like domain-containing protein [Bacteroidales bacterium]